ncbi:MAG: helix-turn-helix transcriptional regulator [Deltaproteobacteria bacterium]|jgi:DNA-binding PadR family transcriptional regulator|nr:helix-turn-helix transcriptional regulator [Deltaproteobacteria bacterium]
MPIIDFDECPCSGKNISTLVAPWILLTLHQNDGLHGYDIQKIILGQLQELGFGLNPGGLYRHLNQLEKRGVLTSTWDTSGPGPAKRKFFLTEAGKECMWRWLSTLSTHATLIGKFMDEAQKVFSNAILPKVTLTSDQPMAPKELS